MANFNKIILVGNLTRDPELKRTKNGTAVTKFGLAVNEYRKGGEPRANFFDIVTWDDTAEHCEKYLEKGSSVLIEGKLKQERWETENGKRSRVVISAYSVTFLDKKDNGQKQTEPEEEGSLPF